MPQAGEDALRREKIGARRRLLPLLRSGFRTAPRLLLFFSFSSSRTQQQVGLADFCLYINMHNGTMT